MSSSRSSSSVLFTPSNSSLNLADESFVDDAVDQLETWWALLLSTTGLQQLLCGLVMAVSALLARLHDVSVDEEPCLGLFLFSLLSRSVEKRFLSASVVLMGVWMLAM